MTREKAIEIVRDTYHTDEEMKALETLIPELRNDESEDERIIKTLQEYVKNRDWRLNGPTQTEVLSWLEEQKDKNCLACDQHLKGYLAGRKATEAEKQKENPKNADSIPADCAPNAKCEDRSLKHTDSFGTDIRDTPAYWRGWDDAMKQKEQKPVDDKAFEEWIDGWFKEHKKKAYPQITMDEKEFKNFCRGIRNIYQQNPAWSEDDEAAYDAFICEVVNEKMNPTIEQVKWLRGIRDKLKSLCPPKAKWSEEDEKTIGRLRSVVNQLASYTDSLDVNGDYCEGDYAELDAWLKDLSLNRKKNNEGVAKLCSNEWSEEDERIIDTIVSVLGQYIDYKTVPGIGSAYATPRYSKEIDWLKSLRPQPKRDCKDCAMFLNGKYTKPHWKPSKEQMEALKDAKMRMSLDGWGLCPLLQSLINELEKL